MGRRVFEVAKELKVDHRKVLERCGELGIVVRNYMSVLALTDEERLRESYQTTVGFSILVHSDIEQQLQKWQHLRSKLHWLLKQLAARGDDVPFKSVKKADPRQHWWRLPLQGNHFYLWYSIQGQPPTEDLNLGRNEIIVRAVREHDQNNDPLLAGERSAYSKFPFDQEVSPLGPEQTDCATSTHALRVLRGAPGSGKTATLWAAIEQRGPTEKVLYLSWSSALVEEARVFLTKWSTAPFEAMTWLDFLGRIDPSPTKNVALTDEPGRALFRRKLEALSHHEARDRLLEHADETFDLVTAWTFGRRPWDGRPAAMPDGTPDAWLREMEANVDETNRLVEELDIDVSTESGAQVFPAAATAFRARRRLLEALDKPSEETTLPKVLRAELTGIVIDEVQDLTPAEIDIVGLVHAAVKHHTERDLWLFTAGDEGQTIRATDFRWPEHNRILTERTGASLEEHSLKASLRFSKDIHEVLSVCDDYLKRLPKAMRPKGQSRAQFDENSTSPVAESRIVVRPSDIEDAASTVRSILEADPTKLAIDQIVIIAVSTPSWLTAAPDLLEGVLSPRQAKGLEWPAVCLVGVEGLLQKLTKGSATRDPIGHRKRVSHLRVAISRATERLFFIADPSAAKLDSTGNKLLSWPDMGTPEFVEGLLDGSLMGLEEQTAESRVRALLNRAAGFLGRAPQHAWPTIKRARQLVEKEGDARLHTRFDRACVKTAWFLLLRHDFEGPVVGVPRSEIVDAAAQALQRLLLAERPLFNEGASSLAQATFNSIDHWVCSATPRSAIELLVDLRELPSPGGHGWEWLADGLSHCRTELTARALEAATEADLAHHFAGELDSWLPFMADDFDSVRAQDVAFEALITADKLERAEAFATPGWPNRRAVLLEAQGLFEEAGEMWEVAGRIQEAVTAYRKAGRWTDALRVIPADSPDRELLGAIRTVVDALHTEELAEAELRLVTAKLAPGEALANAKRKYRKAHELLDRRREHHDAQIREFEQLTDEIDQTKLALDREYEALRRANNERESKETEYLQSLYEIEELRAEMSELRLQESARSTELVDLRRELEDCQQRQRRAEVDLTTAQSELRSRDEHIAELAARLEQAAEANQSAEEQTRPDWAAPVVGGTTILQESHSRPAMIYIPSSDQVLSEFLMSETQVTQPQFVSIGPYNPSHHQIGGPLPVDSVSVKLIAMFCNDLSRAEDRTPAYTFLQSGAVARVDGADGYRLPTETEWEYAARAGGDSLRYANATVLGNAGWNSSNCRASMPVKGKASNAWGLYDTYGNVSEYCQSSTDGGWVLMGCAGVHRASETPDTWRLSPRVVPWTGFRLMRPLP